MIYELHEMDYEDRERINALDAQFGHLDRLEIEWHADRHPSETVQRDAREYLEIWGE